LSAASRRRVSRTERLFAFSDGAILPVADSVEGAAGATLRCLAFRAGSGSAGGAGRNPRPAKIPRLSPNTSQRREVSETIRLPAAMTEGYPRRGASVEWRGGTTKWSSPGQNLSPVPAAGAVLNRQRPPSAWCQSRDAGAASDWYR